MVLSLTNIRFTTDTHAHAHTSPRTATTGSAVGVRVYRPRSRQGRRVRGPPEAGGRMHNGNGAVRPTVLLWDLDNVTPGNRHLTAMAQTLVDLAGPLARIYAAGHAGVHRGAKSHVTALGITLLPSTRRPNGADRALLRIGDRLWRTGQAGRFLVASNDHAFAQLPPAADVVVLTLSPEYVSVRLRARAVAVIPLPHPGRLEGTAAARPLGAEPEKSVGLP